MINFIFSDINIKIILFIVLNGPITLISIIGFNGENIVYVLLYVFKFYINRQVYLYKKNFFDT